MYYRSVGLLGVAVRLSRGKSDGFKSRTDRWSTCPDEAGLKGDRHKSARFKQMGFGTAWGGHLPCKQDSQPGSIPGRSTH